jgi:tetratricopeptide (TPR) repeat protein
MRTTERVALPLFGRTEELAALGGALADAREGRGGLVDIVGEAGIGKSRLVAEFLLGVEGARVVEAPCEHYESSTAYFPFRRLLRDVIGVSTDADEDEVAARLRDRVTALTPGLLPWLPLLGIPLDLSLPPTRETEELDEQFRKTRLEEVVMELLAALLPEPTVLVVEDVHAIDESSADLLRLIAGDLQGRPWLVVVTRREEVAGFVAEPAPHVIPLRPSVLSADEALHLVQVALDEHPLPAQALADLAERGGGNPMFLEALVRDAGRSGTVAELPESVEALVTSQIDRLAASDRSALRYAAVLGMMVDETLLDALLDEHDVRVPRGAMERLGDFLVRDGNGAIRFRSGLMRDVAYEGLPYGRRKVLHDEVGKSIERASDGQEPPCEVLSLHFFHAGRHDKARWYSLLAGDRALAKYAPGEAVEFFARAAKSWPHTGTDPAEVGWVYEKLADARWLLGLTQEAGEAYALARRSLREDPVATAGIIEKEARIDQRRRKHSQALRRITRGLHELEGIAGSGADIARSLLARRYADSRFRQGRFDEALRWAELAARYAEESVDKFTLAAAYEVLNHIYAGSGRPEPLPYGRLALQAYVELGDLRHQGWCRNNLAAQDVTAGRWNESLADFRAAADIFRRIGDTAAEGNALYNEAEILVRQRRYAEALALLPDILRIARAVEDEELVALAQREQARAVAGSGGLEEALALLSDARARFEALAEADESVSTDLVLAEVLQDAGRTQEARDVLALLEGAVDGSATYRRLLGRDHLMADRPDDARSLLTAGLGHAVEASDLLEQALILEELASVGGSSGADGADAHRRAQETLASIGVTPSG